MPPHPRQPLDLPHDLVLAVNLSKDDRSVLDLVASHPWTFLGDDRALWRAAHTALGASFTDALSPPDLGLLAVCLHHPPSRKLVRRLDDCGIFVMHMVDDEAVDSLVCWLCGMIETTIVDEPLHLARLRGLLLVAAASGHYAGDPTYWVWCSAKNAVELAEQEIRGYLLGAINGGKDLGAIMADIDDCSRALAWLNGEPPSSGSAGAPPHPSDGASKADCRAASCGVGPSAEEPS